MTSQISSSTAPRVLAGVVVGVGLAACLVSPASAASSTNQQRATDLHAARAPVRTTAPVAAVGQRFASGGNAIVTARLRGADERPSPGDADGTGAAAMLLLGGAGRVCYAMQVNDIGDVVAGHIHEGGPDVAGPIVIDLKLRRGPNRMFANCVEASPGLVRTIAATPSNYYTNVHTTAFPGGAIRGQLRPLGAG